jgi:uncharacterized protein YkwD
MNIVRIRRIAIHIFFSAILLAAFTTPVFAITAELIDPNRQNTISLEDPLALLTPESEGSEMMGPQKPDTTSSPEPTKLPTPTPGPTNTLDLTPTARPMPTIAPTATPVLANQIASTANASTNEGLNADILFDMSNTYRAGLGLSQFQKDERICALATARAPEIATEIDGGYMHAGKNSHNFPFWFTENIITMRTEAEAFNWWVNDHIHRVQIEDPNTHSCVACQGNACVQHFTSYRPK